MKGRATNKNINPQEESENTGKGKHISKYKTVYMQCLFPLFPYLEDNYWNSQKLVKWAYNVQICICNMI